MTTNDPNRFFVHDLPRVNLSEMPNSLPGEVLSEQQRDILIAAQAGTLYREAGHTYRVSETDGLMTERRIGSAIIAELAGRGLLTCHDGLLFPTEAGRDLIGGA